MYGTDCQTKPEFTNIDVIYYCLRNLVWTNQTIFNLILALSHELIDSQKKSKSFNNWYLTVSGSGCLERCAENKGSLVQFPVEAYLFILNFSLASRWSQLAEDHKKEIKHGFIKSNGYTRYNKKKPIWFTYGLYDDGSALIKNWKAFL